MPEKSKITEVVVSQACRQVLSVAEDIQNAESLEEAKIWIMRLSGSVGFLEGYFDLDIEDAYGRLAGNKRLRNHN